MSEEQKLSEEQMERRLNRVWTCTLASIVIFVVHLLGGLLLPLAGASAEMIETWSSHSQETAAFAIATVTAYVTGSAIDYRR